jgi:hypothetical protein
MEFDTVHIIGKNEKTVLDFLNYLEKETPIKFDMSTLIGLWAWVTKTINETTISMPAEFYTLNITNYPMVMYLRYCPCEYCHEVVYVQLFSQSNEVGNWNAHFVMEHIKKAVPEMIVYISTEPKPISIKNYLADYIE